MPRYPSTQMKVLDFVRDYYAKYRCWPTFRRVGAFLGQDVGAVARYIAALRKKGLLVTGPRGEIMLPIEEDAP